MRRTSALLLAMVAAGCSADLGPESPPATSPALKVPVLPDLVVDHDHKDPEAHRDAVGLRLRGFLDAAGLLGPEAARLSDLQFHENLATVTLNGRAGATSGGFILLDASEPNNLTTLGRYRSGSEDNWYTKFSPDGRFVFLTANGNTNAQSAAQALQEDLRQGVATGPLRGIHIVDVSEPAAPRLVGFFPVPIRVINLAPWGGRDGTTWLFASIIGAPPDARETLPQANYVAVLLFDPARATLQEVARWQPAPAPANAFPHDLSVQRHPFLGQDLLYAAYWDGGAWIVDVTDPLRPRSLGHVEPLDAADHVHTFKPHPTPLGGSHWAVAAPETFAAEPAGTYRLVNVTDPTSPVVAASWTPPPGDVVNTQPLLFSPHEFSLAGGRLFASQYHGGVWVLELPTLAPLATWQRSMGDPARTGDWAVDVETAVWHGGRVYAVDMGSGILVLEPP